MDQTGNPRWIGCTAPLRGHKETGADGIENEKDLLKKSGVFPCSIMQILERERTVDRSSHLAYLDAKRAPAPSQRIYYWISSQRSIVPPQCLSATPQISIIIPRGRLMVHNYRR
ncbi:hypothetical protein S245_069580 [Arachis hypogaea]